MPHIFKCFSELSPEVDYFILENRLRQLQKGSNDCGLFSLANLRSLYQEADPSFYISNKSLCEIISMFASKIKLLIHLNIE